MCQDEILQQKKLHIKSPTLDIPGAMTWAVNNGIKRHVNTPLALDLPDLMEVEEAV